MQALPDDAQSQRAIAWAVALTACGAPGQYEQQVPARYGRTGHPREPTVAQPGTGVHHLLYHSQARQPQGANELATLAEQFRAWNEAQHITGLLCYRSTGQFVQMLEGTVGEVHALFARIQQDKRHYQVEALSDHASATRWFPDWKMALVEQEPTESYWLLGQAEARKHKLVKPQIPIDSPGLLALLQAFSTL